MWRDLGIVPMLRSPLVQSVDVVVVAQGSRRDINETLLALQPYVVASDFQIRNPPALRRVALHLTHLLNKTRPRHFILAASWWRISRAAQLLIRVAERRARGSADPVAATWDVVIRSRIDGFVHLADLVGQGTPLQWSYCFAAASPATQAFAARTGLAPLCGPISMWGVMIGPFMDNYFYGPPHLVGYLARGYAHIEAAVEIVAAVMEASPACLESVSPLLPYWGETGTQWVFRDLGLFVLPSNLIGMGLHECATTPRGAPAATLAKAYAGLLASTRKMSITMLRQSIVGFPATGAPPDAAEFFLNASRVGHLAGGLGGLRLSAKACIGKYGAVAPQVAPLLADPPAGW